VKAARSACGYASLIIIDDATAKSPCRDSLAAVVTARDLARSGSAAVYLSESADMPATIRFAVEQDYRPWHMQRRFSREARGMAPYERKKGRDRRRQDYAG
jgi:competence protein ComEC